MKSTMQDGYHKVGVALAKFLIERGEGFPVPTKETKLASGRIPDNPNHALELCAGYVAEVCAGRDEARAKDAAYHDPGLITDFGSAWDKASKLLNKYEDVLEKVAKQYQRENLTDEEVRDHIDEAIGDRL